MPVRQGRTGIASRRVRSASEAPLRLPQPAPATLKGTREAHSACLPLFHWPTGRIYPRRGCRPHRPASSAERGSLRSNPHILRRGDP
jgi:hypothetical protein